MGTSKPRSLILSEHKGGPSPRPSGNGAKTSSVGKAATNGAPGKTAGKPSSSPGNDPPAAPSPAPPRHPQYKKMEDRLASFVAWPYRVVRQDPRILALCGFFYIGSADRVRCFSCGSTLRNWEPGDSPHREHRAWAPDCSFIADCPEPSPAEVEKYTSPVPLTTTITTTSTSTTTPPPAPASVPDGVAKIAERSATVAASVARDANKSTNVAASVAKDANKNTTVAASVAKDAERSASVANSAAGNAAVAKEAAVTKDTVVAKDAALPREHGAAGEHTVIAMQEKDDRTPQQTPGDAEMTTTSAREETSGVATVTDDVMQTPVVLAVLEMGMARLRVQEAIRQRLASSQSFFPSAGDLYLAAEAVVDRA